LCWSISSLLLYLMVRIAVLTSLVKPVGGG
jgi:hypothetical protein